MRELLLSSLLASIVTVTAWAAEPPGEAAGELFLRTCGACHAAPYPQRLDWPRWRHTLRLMRQRMREAGMPEPTDVQWRSIAAYLREHARR